MKKIKFIPLFLLAIAFIATSCAIDDDDPVVGVDIITKTVTLTDDTDVIVAKSDTPYAIGLSIDMAFGTNALVEYTVNDGDEGTTVPFGNTSGNILLDVSTAGTYTITLTNVSVLEKPAYVDAVVGESKVINITVVPFATLPDADPDALQVVLAWEDMEINDLDLYIADDSPVTLWYERSWSTTPFEMVSFSNSYDDATYNILVDDTYNANPTSDEIGVYLAVIHPDGTVEYFVGAITSGSGYSYFVKFDKVEDMYTMTQVPNEPVF